MSRLMRKIDPPTLGSARASGAFLQRAADIFDERLGGLEIEALVIASVLSKPLLVVVLSQSLHKRERLFEKALKCAHDILPPFRLDKT